ncbi:MAG: hypothetical protein AB7R89_18855 [Dehalococcoidia bacterium]
MRCETCDILLDADDNYCRKCGAAVQVESMSVVRQTAQPPALFRSTAAPLATGAAAVAATALLRWVIGQAVRGLLTDDRPRRDTSKSRALSRRDTAVEAAPSVQNAEETVEVFWYRRTGRG